MFVVAVPECDVPSVRALSHATQVRSFRSEEEMFHGFRDVLAELGLRDATIALEKNFFDAALHEVFTQHILGSATVVSATPVMSRLRMLKDDDEVALLRNASRVADVGMDAAAQAIRAGISETMVAAEAEYAMRKAGAEGWATPVYVASGWRSAMAHGPASSKVIEDGDVVQVHIAPLVEGYSADLCRTMFVGEVPRAARDALDVYLDAQEAGIAAAAPGTPLMGIDTAMADVLSARGTATCSFGRCSTVSAWSTRRHRYPGHAVVHGEERVEQVEAG
jgi:Xaa-Pro aminopeptidase